MATVEDSSETAGDKIQYRAADTLACAIANSLLAGNVTAHSFVKAAGRHTPHYSANGKDDAVVHLRICAIPMVIVQMTRMTMEAQELFDDAPFHPIKYSSLPPEDPIECQPETAIYLRSIYRLPWRDAKRLKGKARGQFLHMHALHNLAALVTSIHIPYGHAGHTEIPRRYPDP